MKSIITAVILLTTTTTDTSAFLFTPSLPIHQTINLQLHATPSPNNNDYKLTRQNFLTSLTKTASLTLLLPSHPSNALVKGNAPPPKKKDQETTNSNTERKCRNVEECQELAEQQEAKRQQAAMDEMEALGIKPVTVKGTRFLELESGRESGTVAKEGDAVEVHYKVLKLGKRSYDGLSGEGTVRVLVCFSNVLLVHCCFIPSY